MIQEWKKDGVSVALRSNHDKLLPETDIYMVDTLGLYLLLSLAVCAHLHIIIFSICLEFRL